jgi:hypothetical protein
VTEQTPADDGGRGLARLAGDVVVLVASIVATLLAVVGLFERTSPAGRRPAVAPRGTPLRPSQLRTGPTTALPASSPPLPPVPPDGVACLPVLAGPEGRRPGWVELHDAVDAWTWHEYWLLADRGAGVVLPADGLGLGSEVMVEDDALAWGPGLVAPFPGAAVHVHSVAERVILTRPAARGPRELRPWLVREARALRAAGPHRVGASAALTAALVGFPLAVLLPVLALLLQSPVVIVAASFAPLGVGVISSALRWAALDELDRATTVRVPLRLGVLLVLTGPLHALLRCAAAWSALQRPAPVPLVRVIRVGDSARRGLLEPGARRRPKSRATA